MLLVEDDPGDALMIEKALADGTGIGERRDVHLHVERDGADALAYLLRSGEIDGPTRPDLVLLDLNLPGMGGGSC